MGVIESRDSAQRPEDIDWMLQALALARNAEALGEVPVGAVVVRDRLLLAEGSNSPITSCDPSAHAEIVALRRAGTVSGNYRLPACTLYVTLEPCVMCLGAIIHARIDRLVFGAFDPQRGAICSRIELAAADFLNHRITYTGGVLEHECGELLRAFFRDRRRHPGQLSDQACDAIMQTHGEVPKRS